ncbi:MULTISPECIES: phosphopantetheine-binding protein [Streptomyces]|uniref:Phosphopantetheine-binding protein n=3 Tax=Streptomyces rochei group TaxID=2867164 RepID=A0AAX3ZK33_STRRO|nr:MULTISPECIES: phosphopantetheine-binding protein [Streptomyces]MBD2817394.1 acyl carrier protein [Streptomyces parvulus]RIH62178.1 acyl carrier protein [Streptomyces sp. SHP22-7]WDI19545.1 phosphopantetheine-binding protein [Streptomyces enissocaesilis]MBJ6620589.1 acyl carrier protein [Streptomyces sp. DHE17-7]MBQ0881970.1 acyl carrier protein [Streptomyces sp. RT42]
MTGSVSTMIIEILTGKFEIPQEEVARSTVFEDLAVDSLALLEMSLLLEKRLGVSIAEGVLTSQQSIDEAARAVEALSAPAAVGSTV